MTNPAYRSEHPFPTKPAAPSSDLPREADNTGLDVLPPPPSPRAFAPALPTTDTFGGSSCQGNETPPPCIPGYEMLGLLGQGGMGKVYQARQLSLNRLVAVKVIRSGDLADADARARFLREAHAVARLQHVNIVQVFEVGEHEGRPFLVMEMVDGGSLDRRVKGQPQLAATAAALVTTLAHAMHAVHQQGLLHRDLKPANVLLAGGADHPLERCTLKITDFGLVKRMVDSETVGTPTQAVVGTPNYMAPEQAGGPNRALGPPTDVHALGAILYELLTGRPPFAGVTTVETLLQVLANDPVPPRRLQPGVPRDLETVCLQCLRKKSAERYASALALAQDLERFSTGQPVRARPVGPWERGWKWARRSPWVAGLAAALIVVAVTAFALVTWKWLEAIAATDAAETAQRATDAALRAADVHVYYDLMSQADQEDLANNAGGAEALLDRCPLDLRRVEWDLRKRRGHDDILTFRADDGPVNCVAFRFDGLRLATGGGDLLAPNTPSKVRVWDPATGDRLLDLEGHRGPVTYVTFSPDGQWLASASYRVDMAAIREDRRSLPGGEILVWSLKEGKRVHKLDGQGCVAFAPDGRNLAAPSGGAGAKLWNLNTGKLVKQLAGLMGRVVCLAFSPDGRQLAFVSDKTRGPAVLGKADAVLSLWNTETGAMDGVVGHLDQVAYNMAFSHDGRRVAVATGEQVRVWDLRKTAAPVAFKGHASEVFDVQFSPDDTLLAACSRNGTVKVWDVARGQEIRTLRGHCDQVTGVAFDPKGDAARSRLASVSFDGLVKIWYAQAGQASWSILADARPLSGLALSPDGSRLATAAGLGSGVVKLWNAQTRRLEHSFACPGTVRLAFSRQGSLLAASGGEPFAPNKPGVVRLWDVAERRELPHVPRHPLLVTALALSPDGRFLASASGNEMTGIAGAMMLWDLVEKRAVASFHADPELGCISDIAFSPNGTLLALASLKGTVTLCEAATGQVVRTLPGKKLYRVAFNRAGTRLAVGDVAGGITLWDLEEGKELNHWLVHDGAISGLAFTADGERIIAASYKFIASKGALKIWDTVQGREAIRLPGQVHVALSHDGRRLASLAVGDITGPGMVTIWDATPAGVVPTSAR